MELRRAAATADALGSPLIRWQARAPLARALAATGAEPDVVYSKPRRLFGSSWQGFPRPHAGGYLAAPQVAEVLDAVR